MLSYETDIPPLVTEWNWRNYFPRGECVVLAGPGGVGKGQLLTLVEAHISTGAPLPGETETRAPGDCISITPEDSLSETSIYRLRAARANLARVFDLTELDDGTPFDASQPTHIGQLRAAVDSLPSPRLIVIDPIAACVSKSLASVHIVRAMLHPLQRLARDTGVTVVLSHHLTKAGAVAGSKGIVDGVRIVLTVNRAPDNPAIRVMSVHKANVLPPGVPDVRYTITGTGTDTRAEFITRAATSHQPWRRAFIAAGARDLRSVAK